jgi:hypothetical protein
MAAISRSQAVIEFDLKGNILSANENFCKALGYSLDEISSSCAASSSSLSVESGQISQASVDLQKSAPMAVPQKIAVAVNYCCGHAVASSLLSKNLAY